MHWFNKISEAKGTADALICVKFDVEKLRGQGYKIWHLPLKRLVTLTTVLRYRQRVKMLLFTNTGSVLKNWT